MTVLLKIWAYDRPGVLDRIAGLIRRKGWNISTLVAAAVDGELSQIDIALEGRGLNEQALGETLAEMDAIRGVEKCTGQSHLLWDFMLICLHEDKRELAKITDSDVLAAIGQAKPVKEHAGRVYLEYSGPPATVTGLMRSLRGWGIRCLHTGTLALALREGDDELA
jgi:acetolactate synthase-1/3 small subunit